MGFSRQEYWSGLPCPPPGDLPNPGIKPRSPRLQADSLPSEPPGKPKNTGVGNLSLLQGNFPTQESNWGLLHCRRILYHMSCQVSLIVSFYSLFFNFLFCSVLFLCSVSGYFCVFCVWLFFIDIMCEKMWRHILRFCLIVSSSRQGFFHSSHQNWFRDEFHTYKICLFLGHSYS